jgi:hypothetical protein
MRAITGAFRTGLFLASKLTAMARRRYIDTPDMTKFAVRVALVCSIAACNIGEETDPRPETLAYITETIFAPSCATANCHSSMVAEGVPGGVGIAFDTVKAANAALQNRITCADYPCTSDEAKQTDLIVLINRRGNVSSLGGYYMPLDQPLSNLDQDLILRWIIDGAEGYTTDP